MRPCIAIGVLALSFGAAPVWAQTQSANIPFAFYVGERHLDAGTYVVRPGEPFEGVVSLVPVTTREGMVVALASPDHRNGAGDSKLVFNKYGENEYFLSQIWDRRSPDSLKLSQSQHEIVVSRMVAAVGPPVQVTIAASRLPASRLP